MGQNFQFIQILIVVIVLALSGLSWITKKLQEQRARKRRMIEQQRRMEEMLRTGRDPLAEQAAALQRATATDRARLEELARRRQAQMEQLRREQMQRRHEAEQASRGGSDIPPIIIMGPSGPIAIPRAQPAGGQPFPGPVAPGPMRPPMGRTAPPRGVPTRPAPASYPPTSRQGQQRQGRSDKQRQKRERQQQRAEQPAVERSPLSEPAPPLPEPGAAARERRRRALGALRIGQGMSREEYRRLIASLELLRPPLALRPPDSSGGASPLV